jgi:hypothetical protein
VTTILCEKHIKNELRRLIVGHFSQIQIDDDFANNDFKSVSFVGGFSTNDPMNDIHDYTHYVTNVMLPEEHLRWVLSYQPSRWSILFSLKGNISFASCSIRMDPAYKSYLGDALASVSPLVLEHIQLTVKDILFDSTGTPKTEVPDISQKFIAQKVAVQSGDFLFEKIMQNLLENIPSEVERARLRYNLLDIPKIIDKVQIMEHLIIYGLLHM